MQWEQPVGSKPLIVRCGVGIFRLQKDKIYVNLTAPTGEILEIMGRAITVDFWQNSFRFTLYLTSQVFEPWFSL